MTNDKPKAVLAYPAPALLARAMCSTYGCESTVTIVAQSMVGPHSLSTWRLCLEHADGLALELASALSEAGGTLQASNNSAAMGQPAPERRDDDAKLRDQPAETLAPCGHGAFGVCCCTCRYLVKARPLWKDPRSGVEPVHGLGCVYFWATGRGPIFTEMLDHGMCEGHEPREATQ